MRSKIPTMKDKQQKIPRILCPFFERECPLGEDTARICWRRMSSQEEMSVDYEEYEVNCLVSEWMFNSGDHPFR